MRNGIFRLVLVGVIIVLVYIWSEKQGITQLIAGEEDLLRGWLLDQSWLGPFAVILLMMVAVVLSPLPSAPVALVAGAVYGHAWGTLYVELGAILGALIAFGISRYLRPESLSRWLETKLSFKRYNSQNTLMLAVCASRLLPFLSFDLVSYAAGLTPLGLWRFTIATMVGVLPASFLLAHMGSEISSFDPRRISVALLVLVLLGVVPLLIQGLRNRRGNGNNGD